MARLTPAVLRSLDILELFLSADEELSAPDITRLTGLPRTTVHELLVTLAARNYLTRDQTTGRYRLGLRLFQLGNAFGERLDLARAAAAVARGVSAECNETVHVAVRDGASVVYVAKVDSTRAVRMVSAVGRTLPAHCTAVGKALLAALGPGELDELYPPGVRLAALTERSITDVAALRRQLTAIAERGISLEDCESNPDVCCVAAPVRDHGNRVVAAMSISVPASRWTPDGLVSWERLVLEGARELSKDLGARTGSTTV